MDAQGNRGVVTGNTPAAGMTAYSASQESKSVPTRDMSGLSVVAPDYKLGAVGSVGGALEAVPRIGQVLEEAEDSEEDALPANAAQRIREARRQQRLRFLTSTTGRVALFLATLIVLALLSGGGYLLSRQTGLKPAVLVTPSVTLPPPTPTGYGDATATPVATSTPAGPAAIVIGVGGWVQVQADGGLAMRDAPTKSGAKLAVLRDGSRAKVIEGPKEADGFTWWKLESQSPPATGWCAGQYLVPIAPPSP